MTLEMVFRHRQKLLAVALWSTMSLFISGCDEISLKRHPIDSEKTNLKIGERFYPFARDKPDKICIYDVSMPMEIPGSEVVLPYGDIKIVVFENEIVTTYALEISGLQIELKPERTGIYCSSKSESVFVERLRSNWWIISE